MTYLKYFIPGFDIKSVLYVPSPKLEMKGLADGKLKDQKVGVFVTDKCEAFCLWKLGLTKQTAEEVTFGVVEV